MEFHEYFAKNGLVSRWWNSPKVGVPLWIVSACCTVYWLIYIPSPGKAIGALAVVAGIMSVRDIQVLGRIGWVALLICLFITEFRAIDKDRADNQLAQKTFFESQQAGFAAVTKQAQQDFSATTASLSEAINGLNTNLDTTKKVFGQTRPTALLQFYDLLPVPLVLPKFSGQSFPITFRYKNSGTDAAIDVWKLGKIYVGPLDENAAKAEIVPKFETAWIEKKKLRPGPLTAVGDILMDNTINLSLSPSEADELNRGGAFYFLFRTEYSDKTGRWVSESCLQGVSGAMRRCEFFDTPRRRIEPLTTSQPKSPSN